MNNRDDRTTASAARGSEGLVSGKAATDADRAARRRLLKASAMAPLVATLQPNAALAMNSASACIQTNAVSNHKGNGNANSMDNVYRIEVDFFETTGNGNGGGSNNQSTTILDCTDVGALPDPSHSAGDTNKLYRIDSNMLPPGGMGGYYNQAGEIVYGLEVTPEQLECAGYSTYKKWVVGVFDVSGEDSAEYLGVWPVVQDYDDENPTLTATPLTQSCMTSLATAGWINMG